ncbi:response regulator [Candidatus Neomarinimicrobiota bacterium]
MSEEKKNTILVVEDNPANTAYMMFMLKKLNLPAINATSGEEAVELLKEHTVHCGLLDIHLGEGMSGIKVMEHIRNLKNMSKIPLVAVTAFYAGDMSKQLLDSGFDDYLAKPYKFNELEKILKKNGII